MSHVFVVDMNKRPLNPVHPGQARRWLTQGRAAVWRRYPFTIITKHQQPDVPVDQFRLKLDPGSQTTGIAIIHETSGEVVAAVELAHRGQRVREALSSRRAVRRSRRSRHTRFRPARFDNRTRPDGWLAPSLESRVQNILTWVQRFQRLCPLSAISLELVHFDTQLLQYPEIRVCITATGRHSRQMCRTNACGFPDKAAKATSMVGGYRTGDLVRAVVPGTSRKAGVYVGRLAVRATGWCNLRTAAGTIQGIHVRYCWPLHRVDGYTYGYLQKGVALLPSYERRGLRTG